MDKIVPKRKILLQKILKSTGILLFIFEMILLFFALVIFPIANDEFSNQPYHVRHAEGVQLYDPDTIIWGIENRQENLFTLAEENDQYSYITKRTQEADVDNQDKYFNPEENKVDEGTEHFFTTSQYRMIAEAATEAYWHNDISEWYIVDIFSQGTLCENGELIITSAFFTFESEVETEKGKETITHEVFIGSQNKYIKFMTDIEIRKRKNHFQYFEAIKMQYPEDHMEIFYPKILEGVPFNDSHCVGYTGKYIKEGGAYYWNIQVYNGLEYRNSIWINAKTGRFVESIYYYNMVEATP